MAVKVPGFYGVVKIYILLLRKKGKIVAMIS